MADKQPSQETAKPTKTPRPTRQLPSAASIFRRYHGVIYTLGMGLGLSIAVILLLSIVTESSDTTGFTANTTNTSFDTDTIEKINQLKPINETPDQVDLPSSGRINPFRR